MQLPDFIKRSVAFFDKAEASMTAADVAKTKISELELSVSTLNKEKTTAEASLVTLRADLLKAQTDLTAAKDDAAKEKARANATIAGQGLPADQLPATEAAKGGKAETETAWTKYQRLLSENPRAAGAFWASDSEKIIQSRA